MVVIAKATSMLRRWRVLVRQDLQALENCIAKQEIKVQECSMFG
jgi:hypothetical protein